MQFAKMSLDIIKSVLIHTNKKGARTVSMVTAVLIMHTQRIFIFFVEYGFYFTERSGKYLYFISGEATNEIYIFFTSRVK